MKTPKILVVDDERSIRQAIRFELEEVGYEVIYATNFSEAFEMYQKSDTDMIITDLFLEKENGVELIQKIKKEKNEFPVIVITAIGQEEETVWAQKLGADACLTKPFSSNHLLEVIQSLIEK